MKEIADVDVVDYIEADEDEREEIDDEFKIQRSEIVAAMHIATPHQAGATNWRGIYESNATTI